MLGLLNPHYRDHAALSRSGEGVVFDGASHRMTGFTAGTRLATAMGWRPAEAITVGDEVLTFDHGVQMVVAVTRGTHIAAAGDLPAFAVPIHVPIGAIGNEEPMVLLPDQIVMLESDAAETLTGDPFALVPASALEGFRGIDRIRGIRPVEVVSLHFEDDEVVFADGGALMFAPAAMLDLATIYRDQGQTSPYTVRRGPHARALVDAMATEDARAFARGQGARAA